MDSNELNIVCTIDDHYAIHCTVMLQSLFCNNKDCKFRIFIIHNGLSKQNQAIIFDFLIREKQRSEFILIDEKQIENAPITDHISVATYFRILIPEVIDQKLKKVLFLDSDIIIRSSIKELWEVNVDQYPIAASLEYISKDYKCALGMKATSDYFNAGVLLINLDNWRKENWTRKILAYIKENHAKLLTWDQDALNIAFENNWKRVSPIWNVGHNFFRDEHLDEYFQVSKSEYARLKEEPKIIHFSGSLKPWFYTNTHPFKKEYLKYKRMTPWKKVKLIDEPLNFDKCKFFLKRILKKYVWNRRYISF